MVLTPELWLFLLAALAVALSARAARRAPPPAATPVDDTVPVDPGGTAPASPQSLDLARLHSISTEAPALPGYTLEGVLGKGAFGVVFRGVQLSTGQPVAVKVLAALRSAIPNWEREMRRLSKVSEHPNIVTLVDANLEHDPPFLVTPLLPGSLEERVGADLDQVGIWFWQVAQALQFVHSRGILHCDLKPSNILLGPEGQARVVDFGQAVELEEEGLRLGTFWFMPPEQAEGGLPQVGWDIYALGATIYRLLTGRLPRATSAAQQALSQPATGQEKVAVYRELLETASLEPVRRLNPRVDPELAAIVERCLAPDPSARYAGVGEVLDDLRRRRERRPVTARPATRAYLVERFVSRHRVAVSVALVALLALGLTAFGNYRQRETTRLELATEQFSRGLRLLEQGRSSGLVWLGQAAGTAPEREEYRLELARRLEAHPRLAGPALYRVRCNPAPSPSGLWALVRDPEDRNRRLVLNLATGETSPLTFGPLNWDQRDRIRYRLDGVVLDPVHGKGGPAVWQEPITQSSAPMSATTMLALFVSPELVLRAQRTADGSLQVVDSRGRTVLSPRVLPGHAAPVFSLQGDLAVGWDDGPVDLYRRAAGWERASFAPGFPGEVLRFSPDGALLAVHDGDDLVRIFRGEEQACQLSLGHTATDMAFSQDGRLLVAGTRDGVLRSFDPLTGRPVYPGVEQERPPEWVYVQPGGGLVTMSDEAMVWQPPRPGEFALDVPLELLRLRTAAWTGWVFDEIGRVRMVDDSEYLRLYREWQSSEATPISSPRADPLVPDMPAAGFPTTPADLLVPDMPGTPFPTQGCLQAASSSGGKPRVKSGASTSASV